MNVRFSILGPVRAFDGPRRLRVGGPKQRALLAALLVERGRFVSRDALVDAVWGEVPPASAAAAIQVYVHGLRRALGAERIETRGTSYRIVAETEELDAARFDALLMQAQRALEAGDAAAAVEEAEAALAQWSGPALTDLDPGTSLGAAAAALEEQRMQAVLLRNEAALAVGRHHELVAGLAELVAAHPYRERLREQLIVALYRCGRQEEALAAYRVARRTLIEEVGIEPGPRLRELEAAILRQEPALDALPRAPAPAPAPPRSLPAPPTQLIGREPELDEIVALFTGEGARLVTLTGPGGVGKTRLAIAAAERLADAPVWVDLAPVPDPELVPQAVAEALGLDERPEGHAAAVSEHLAGRQALLVLDNFERLLAAAGFVADVLARAPEARILVTSRGPLRVRAEHELSVPPLAGGDAVALFASRARAADRSFVLDAQLEPWVERICRRLDGLPLAIELAAARLRTLGPQQLDAALERRLELLVDGPVDLPERQRALRATLDWSHDVLAEDQRRDFARLAVLSASGSRAAVDALCGAQSAQTLRALIAASLVHPLGDDRYGMLETVREYALERLDARGEAADARRVHAQHFLEVAERARETMLDGRDGDAAYAALERDQDNLRAALVWASEAGEVEIEVRLVCALRQFWLVRGHVAEGRRFFERAVADSEEAPPRLRAQALMHGGPFAHRQSALDQARAWWEEALSLLRELGDAEGVARCAGELGGVAFSEGDLDGALAASTESARAFAGLGDDLRLAIVLSNMAEIETARGDLEAAARHGEQAVALQRALGDRQELAITLQTLARVRRRAGEEAQARTLLIESLEHARAFDYREVIAAVLADTAELALADDRVENAARLLARAGGLRDEIGVYFAEDEHAAAQLRGTLEERLGAERLAGLEAEALAAPLAALADDAAAVLRAPPPA